MQQDKTQSAKDNISQHYHEKVQDFEFIFYGNKGRDNNRYLVERIS